MKTLLRIDASARTKGSHTRTISDYYQKQWQEQYPKSKVIIRDVERETIPHLSSEMIDAFQEGARTSSATIALSNLLIEELNASDHLLISSPLYNLTLPSTLKAYFDYVVRSGLTFGMEGEQCVGLLSDKSATIITARGGLSSADIADDFQTDYLKKILAFIGIKVLEVIALEGTSLSETEKSRSFMAVKKQIDNSFQKVKAPLWIGQFSLEEKKEITFLRDEQAKSIINGNALNYAKLCTDDIQLLIPGHDLISGQDQFLLAEENLFKRTSFASFTKYPERLERSDEMLVEIGYQELSTENRFSKGGGLFNSTKIHAYLPSHSAGLALQSLNVKPLRMR